MILQALTAYYDRLLDDGAVQPPGFQEKEIPWIVELHRDGRFRALIATGDGKRGRPFTVPMEVKKSVNIAANLLWDNPEYVFGIPRDGADAKQAAKVPLRHGAFLERLHALAETVGDDDGLAAVLAFLEAGDFSDLTANPRWAEVTAANANVSFRLAGETHLVCERPAAREAVAALAEAEGEGDPVRCLVTGRREPPARLHPSIRGVRGAQTSGANLVSFNLDAFESHGWTQGLNAPVGRHSAHAYVAALNHLLRRDNDTHHHIEGEVTFVFWAAETTPLEDDIPVLFGRPAVQTEADGSAVRDALTSARRGGRPPAFDDPTPYYVLALAPNAARLAVRLWHEGTVGDLLERFARHFEDLTIDGLDGPSETPGLWRLLAAASTDNDVEKLSDTLRGALAAETMTAILKGTPYPAQLFARVVERCRVEQGKRDPRTDKRRQSVTRVRAALIKASLNRRIRLYDTPEKEVTVSLDPDNTNPGYLLGRLFAVLEDVQYQSVRARGSDASINVTIRDRYFSAVMTAPRSVVRDLMKLRDAHLKKLRHSKPGFVRKREKEFDSILDKIPANDGFPATLTLEDQGRYILGYHHQRAALWPAKDARPEDALSDPHDHTDDDTDETEA